MDVYFEDSIESGTLSRGQDMWRSEAESHSNAFILPKREKQKRKNKRKVDQLLKAHENVKMSKSQKKFRKKLEEDKKQALILSNSKENIEKHKIQDNVYPRLSSSSNIGQETEIEKPKDHTSMGNLVQCTEPSVPVVVHVNRPKEVDTKRKDLSIVMMEQEIMEAINENNSVIICGETGCGKTTQVPQFLYEAGFSSDKSRGIIGITQPRLVSVLGTANRVAFEMGLKLGKEIGFQIQHNSMVGENCSIKFMTDGILLREVQSDILLRKYSVIILDEAHERSLNTDILIGMLSKSIQLRQEQYEKVYPLKLILMSATLRVEDFISENKIFCAPPPVIEVPTRQYPVTMHFSKRTDIVDYIGQAYKKVMAIHKRLPPGGILFSLPEKER